MKSLQLLIFFFLLGIVSYAQQLIKNRDYVEGEIIIGYELTHQLKSRSSIKNTITSEYSGIAELISKECNVRVIKKTPVCSWLVEQMIEEDKTESEIFNEAVRMKSASTYNGVKLSKQLVLTVENDQTIDGLIKLLEGKTFSPYKIVYACRNHIYYINEEKNDPLLSVQWSHKITKADSAWKIQTGSPDVVIGIIDTGVDYLHPDLATNMVPGYDFVDLGVDSSWILSNPKKYPVGEDYLYPDTDPMDYYGHGTHCAGIVVANANNGVGVVGVAPNCKVMPLRAAFYDSGKSKLRASFIISAINYAANNGVDIISMSFSSGPYSRAFVEALKYAHARGLIMVASAGNDNSMVLQYPAGYIYVVSVGSTTIDDKKAPNSNYGEHVDIMAPGDSIMSTYPLYSNNKGNSNGYGLASGTSMASPYIAGTLALMKSQKPEYSNPNIIATLLNTADSIDFTNQGYLGKFFNKRVNVLNALNAIPRPLVVFQSITNVDTLNNELLLFPPGQIVNLQVSLKNVWESTGIVNCVLKTEDQFATIIQDQFIIDSLLTNQVVSNNKLPFKFKIDDEAPDNYTIRFQLELEYDNKLEAIPYTITTSVEDRYAVPGDFASIQNAIDAAGHGDVIVVDPGEYFENINFRGKNLTVASMYLETENSDYIKSTIINGSMGIDSVMSEELSRRAVCFSNNENRAAKLIGFTITGGSGTNKMISNGGGIYCENSSPHLKNLLITKNEMRYGTGVGVYMNKCLKPPLLENITFDNNRNTSLIAAYYGKFEADGINISRHFNGTPIFMSEVSASIRNVTISDCSLNQKAIDIIGGDSIFIEIGNIRDVAVGISAQSVNYLKSSDVLIDATKISGVSCVDVNEIHICNSEILNCELYGLRLRKTRGVTVDNSSIQHAGGGLYLYECDSVNVSNLLVSNCYSFGGIKLFQSNVNFINVTVANNFSEFSSYAGGISVFGLSKVNLLNSIIYGNRGIDQYIQDTISNSFLLPYNTQSWLTIAYSNIEGNLENLNLSSMSMKRVSLLEGSLDTVPMFYKPHLYDYHLSVNSPLRTKGSTFFKFGSDVLIELDSSSYFGESPDMGAFPDFDSFVEAGFNASAIVGKIPLEVQFENTSYAYQTQSPDSFIWVFSKTDTIYDRDPSYIFQEEGWQSVELLVNNGIMSDSIFEQKYIYAYQIDTFYVDVQGSDSLGTGSAENPFGTIQVAVSLAGQNDVVIVNSGTYYEQVNIEGEGFTLASKFLETEDSSFITNTIIDGNYAQNVLSVNDQTEGEMKVVGFTIQNGFQTDVSEIWYGAGVFCSRSNPFISNCIIRDNKAYKTGGGMCLYESNATVTDCLIENNKTQSKISEGGGVAVVGGLPSFTRVSILNNRSNSVGGGMFINAGEVRINNSKFIQNETIGDGGGIFSQGGKLIMDETSMVSNRAHYKGGGIYLDKRISIDDVLIKRSVFESNLALNEGGAIYCSKESQADLHNLTLFKNKSKKKNSGGIFFDENCSSTVTSSILWNNQPKQLGLGLNDDSITVISFSTIEGGFLGDGNIDLDPIFIDTAASNFNLNIHSTCIDGGSKQSATDPDGSVADMGAFYFDQTYPLFYDSIPDLIACYNDGFQINVDVRGVGPLYFNWYKDGWKFGEGNPLVIETMLKGYAGEFYCIVTNNKRKSVSSNLFTIDVQSSSSERSDTVIICNGGSFFVEGELQTTSGIYTNTYSNVYGCDSTIIVYLNVENCTSNAVFENNAKVYPNPSTGLVNIESEKFKEASIYTIHGVLMNTYRTTIIELNDLPRAVYFLVITMHDDSQRMFKLFLTD